MEDSVILFQKYMMENFYKFEWSKEWVPNFDEFCYVCVQKNKDGFEYKISLFSHGTAYIYGERFYLPNGDLYELVQHFYERDNISIRVDNEIKEFLSLAP